MKDKYYVYAWFIKGTMHIFYIGKGHKSRATSTTSGRNKKFKKILEENECDVLILKYCDSEEQAYDLERELILYYKSLGQADANIRSGGEDGRAGGPFFANDEERKKFVEKMTKINRERCSKEEFRELHRRLFKEKYSDEKERLLQAEKAKIAWSNEELRKRQSEIVKNSYNDELREVRRKAMERKTILEFNNELIHFKSLQDCVQYIKDTYNFNPNRRTIIHLLKGNSYEPFHKKFKHLEGLKIYYE